MAFLNNIWGDELEDLKAGELNMSVSAVCRNEQGNKYAFVTFNDGVRTAEGKIPDCKIIKNDGFAEIEVQQLERYLKEHLTELKKMAASIDIFSAFKGE